MVYPEHWPPAPRPVGARYRTDEQRLLLEPRRPRHARVVEPTGGEPWWNVGPLVTEIPGSTLPRAVVLVIQEIASRKLLVASPRTNAE